MTFSVNDDHFALLRIPPIAWDTQQLTLHDSGRITKQDVLRDGLPHGHVLERIDGGASRQVFASPDLVVEPDDVLEPPEAESRPDLHAAHHDNAGHQERRQPDEIDERGPAPKKDLKQK
jgi:hypothetical protein